MSPERVRVELQLNNLTIILDVMIIMIVANSVFIVLTTTGPLL